MYNEVVENAFTGSDLDDHELALEAPHTLAVPVTLSSPSERRSAQQQQQQAATAPVPRSGYTNEIREAPNSNADPSETKRLHPGTFTVTSKADTHSLSGSDKPHSIKREEHDEVELKNIFSRSRYRICLFLWCLGLINNFHYNLVISGANTLASNFGMKRYVALISFMNVFFGIIARLVNAFVAHRISYNIRVTLMSCGTIVGLLIVSFAADLGRGNDTVAFIFLLIGVAFTGTSYSYGETVALTFVQRYPPNIVGAWSSGTGISGVITALLFIGLTSVGLSARLIFLISLPLAVAYWFVFTVGLVAPHKVVTVTYVDGSRPPKEVVLHRGFEEAKMLELTALGDAVEVSDYAYKMVINLRGLSWMTVPAPATTQGTIPVRHIIYNEDTTYAPATDVLDAVLHENRADGRADDLHYPFCRLLCGCCSRRSRLRSWWSRNGAVIRLMHNTMFWFFFNLAVVYVAEYAAQFMAPFSFYCKTSWEDNFWVKNSYTITQVCYQLGVFISRSSLMCVRIPCVGVLSILQVINAVGWLVQAKTKFVSLHGSLSAETAISFVLFGWMLFVGLIGGASYVNVFFLILSRGKAMQESEEDAMVLSYLAERPATQGRSHHHTVGHFGKEPLVALADGRDMWCETEQQREESVTAVEGGSGPPEVVVVTTVPPSFSASPSLPLPSSCCRSPRNKRTLSSTTGADASNSALTVSRSLSKKEVEGYVAETDSGEEEEDANGRAGGGDRAQNDEEEAPLTDPMLVRIGMANRKLSRSEEEEIRAMRRASEEEWQRRRELGMSLGSLYAMVGICVGTMLDVLFTNTFLSSTSTCEEG